VRSTSGWSPREITSEERAELAQLRRENRQLRGKKEMFRQTAAHFGKK